MLKLAAANYDNREFTCEFYRESETEAQFFKSATIPYN